MMWFTCGCGHEVPVYNSVADATAAHEVDATVIFVPPKFATGAIR